MIKGKQIDPEMDMTEDMDFRIGTRGLGYWFTTIEDIPIKLFKSFVFGKSFLDLGAGDGRLLRLATRCGAKKVRGIEIDPELFKDSIMKRFIKLGDLVDEDLSKYDAIYYYLGSAVECESRLLENLQRFEGTLFLYYRKIDHKLQPFRDNLINEGFRLMNKSRYMDVYHRWIE